MLTLTILLLVIQPLINNAAPIDNDNDDDNNNNNTAIIYDQRQNGSENVRVNVRDVFFVWAPEGGDTDFLDYPNEEVPQNASNEVEKPTSIFDILNSFATSTTTTTIKPSTEIIATGMCSIL